jgi:hypothetical protein
VIQEAFSEVCCRSAIGHQWGIRRIPQIVGSNGNTCFIHVKRKTQNLVEARLTHHHSPQRREKWPIRQVVHSGVEVNPTLRRLFGSALLDGNDAASTALPTPNACRTIESRLR